MLFQHWKTEKGKVEITFLVLVRHLYTKKGDKLRGKVKKKVDGWCDQALKA